MDKSPTFLAIISQQLTAWNIQVLEADSEQKVFMIKIIDGDGIIEFLLIINIVIS